MRGNRLGHLRATFLAPANDGRNASQGGEMRMEKPRAWEQMRTMSARLLKERTGEGLATWNRRIKKERLPDEESLRAWLTKHGVTGYAQSLLVMERFEYPDFMTASADELIDGQYADRPHLRSVFDAVVEAAV